MKILVAIKRVIDHTVKVRLTADGSAIDTDGVKMSANPFDENALEEAVRLKEAGIASEILAVTIGPASHDDVLRQALALGATRALRIDTDAEIQPLAEARLLKALAEREAPQLVLLGKQAIDDDAGQTAQMLAALLNWPQATFASQLTINGQQTEVVREIDGGTETVALNLPAVVSADLRLNDPRFAKLPALMMAKKKPLELLSAAELGADLAPRLKRVALAEPAARQAGVKVANVAELVAKLREQKVLA